MGERFGMGGLRGACWTVWLALVAAAFTQQAAQVRAQCEGDGTPRVTWSYPKDGQTVSPYAPVLLRLVGTLNGLPTFRAGSDPSKALTMQATTVVHDFAGTSDTPFASPVEVTVPLASPVTIDFTTEALDAGTPPTENLRVVVLGHRSGVDAGGLTQACREIVFAADGEPCWAEPGTFSVGLEVQLEAVRFDGSGVRAMAVPRAWQIVLPSGLPQETSQPRLWPAECGLPRLFSHEDIDHETTCFRVAAYTDTANPLKVALSDMYCLGGGKPWPVEIDAGSPSPDAGMTLPPQQPPPIAGGFGFCGCNCPPGVPMACDYIDAGRAGRSGAGGNAGAQAPVSGTGAATGGRSDDGVAAMPQEPGASESDGAGCGCRMAAPASQRGAVLAPLAAGLVLALRRRKRSR